MNRKILAIMAFAIAFLSLSACSSSEDKDDVFFLNKDSVKKQLEASDNGYCPLLPYPFDPRTPTLQEGEQERIIEYPDGSVTRITRQPDGSIEVTETHPVGPNFDLLQCENREELEAIANSLRDSILPGGKPYYPNGVPPNYSFCDNISKAQLDSIRVIYDAYEKTADSLQKIEDAWQSEVWRVRNDPTRTATVTFSKGQTAINLSPVFVEVDLKWVQLEGTQKNDTLYINAVPGKNGSYGQISGWSSCPISLDIALNYIIDENIKVVVFQKGQIFQVKRQ